MTEAVHMTSPHPCLQRVGRYWHFNLKINGQRAHGSTRCTDLATARKVLEHKRRQMIEGQLNREPKSRTLRELTIEWLRINRATFSLIHLRTSECCMRRWVLPLCGSTFISQMSLQLAMEVRASMLEKGCSPVYVNNTFKVLKAVLNYGVRARYITELPFRLPKLRVQQKPRAIVPASQFCAFLATVDEVAKNPHVAVLLKVMLGLGLREAEALGMRWEWFDVEQQTYTVGKAKGKEARVVPVPGWLWAAIHAMPKFQLSEWVFPAEDGTREGDGERAGGTRQERVPPLALGGKGNREVLPWERLGPQIRHVDGRRKPLPVVRRLGSDDPRRRPQLGGQRLG